MKKKTTSRIDLDWYLIPVSSIKRIAIIIFSIVFFALIVYLIYTYYQSPKIKAQRYLKQADEKVEEIAKLSNFSYYRVPYQELKASLQTAQDLYLKRDYASSIEISLKVLEDAFKTLAMARQSASGVVEEIIDLEGKVQIQRKDQAVWEDAKPRMSLFAGDFVKTFSNGSVRIMTKNNSIIVLPPNSLHEVAEPIVTKAGEAIEKITMKAGSVDITTQNQKAQVITLHANAELDKYTYATVSISENKTEIQTARGGGRVFKGEKEYELKALEKIKIEEGKEPEKVKVLPSPKLLEPPLNKAFLYSPNLRIKLVWEKIEGALYYVVQVSSSSLFVYVNEDKRTKNYVNIEGAEPGDYYWRVKAVDQNGNSSQFSMYQKFRVLTSQEMEKLDKVPPQLEVKAAPPLGNQCIIEGRTEPGAIVIIEGETITPNVDGTFSTIISLRYVGENLITVQAVDPAGNETVKKLRVYVRE